MKNVPIPDRASTAPPAELTPELAAGVAWRKQLRELARHNDAHDLFTAPLLLRLCRHSFWASAEDVTEADVREACELYGLRLLESPPDPASLAVRACRAISEERGAKCLPNALEKAAPLPADPAERRRALIDIAASLFDEADRGVDHDSTSGLDFGSEPAEYLRRFGSAMVLLAEAIAAVERSTRPPVDWAGLGAKIGAGGGR